MPTTIYKFRSTNASLCRVDRNFGAKAKHMYSTRLPGPDGPKLPNRSSKYAKQAKAISVASPKMWECQKLGKPKWVILGK